MHEIGHLIFLHFFRARPTRLGAALSGLKIDYSGAMTDVQEMLAALAGPAFGLLFSFICARFGTLWDSDYLRLCVRGSASLSILLTFCPFCRLTEVECWTFFLRALLREERAACVLRIVGLGAATLLVASGLYLISSGLSPAFFPRRTVAFRFAAEEVL